jgi:Ribonuclease G/E
VCKPLESDEGTWRACIELPGASKEHLDAARSEVLPTLTRHHRLRAAQTKGLERMESDLLNHPERKAPLEQRAFRNLILAPLARRERVHIEHVKPCGKSIPPRIGRLVKTENNHFIMKRIFLSDGRYDGLDLPMERGDYGITEAREGQWCIKHSYYSAQGRLKGEYYNINTPVELYPFGGRYLDLEIDVVRRAGEKPFLVDRDKFAVLAREGAISQALYRKAVETAESLMRELTQ